jgi:DNA gyrase subunit A
MQNDGTKIIPVDIEKEMKKSFLDYSMSVIASRALPDVRDGLKPVHRRILYTMHENGLSPSKAYRKSADTVGSVLGRYHPHGDASVYDALVRMAQDFSLRYPLVDGHGNFGSVDGDPPAAYRYTEARMSEISMHMLTDIEKETVDFGPNYDDNRKEPLVLPSRFPQLLVNGSTGIAVGMATNIPPHNMKEVIDAVDLVMENPEATLEEIMDKIKGPDFPTGGIIMGRSGIRAAYATGRGKILLRARAEIEEMKNGRYRIAVTEIPYAVNKARMIEGIADLVKDKRIEGISDLRDESDRNGLRFVIELKASANPQLVLNQLYQYSQMQETYGIIQLALVDGQPRILTIKEMLQYYISFQTEVITRRTKYELRKARERVHILEGLRIALDFIDEVIAILRASKDRPSGRAALMERFGLSELQAQAIVNMQLGQLTGLEQTKIEEELAQLTAKIEELNAVLADEGKIHTIIRDELAVIGDKFKDERRTEIQAVSGEMDIEDLIPQQDCVITLTHFGYLKRQNMDVYKTQRRGGRGISGLSRRDEDFVEEMYLCSSHDSMMLFTNQGRVFRLKAYEIPESSRTARGTNAVNLIQLAENEKITSMIKASGTEDGCYLVMVTKKGIMKRIELIAFRNVRKTGLIAVALDDGDELAWVKQTSGDDQLIIATKFGQAIRFPEDEARPLGRTARGVKAISLEEGDEVVGMARLRDGATLLTITEKGFGRRSVYEEYRMQSRAGKGIINYKVNEDKGYVTGIKSVDDNDDVIMITDDGVIIRIPVEQVNVQSRYASGVRVMRVTDGGRIVTVARAPKEEVVEEMEDTDNEENEE